MTTPRRRAISRSLRVIDREGTIRVQRSRAYVRTTGKDGAASAISALWQEATAGSSSVPGLILMFDWHLVDLSGVETLAQALALAASELEPVGEETPLVLLGVPHGQPV